MATITGNNQPIIITSKQAHRTTHRTKYDIWCEILESCIITQRTKFWLTSRLRLSWKVINESLRFLTKAKLIEAIENQNDTTKYQTTPKGRGALRTYKILVNEYFTTT